MAKKSAQKRPRRTGGRLTPGRHGRVRFGGGSEVKVVVVEDRGPVGYTGRRLVRVRYADPEADPASTFEVPADELVLATPRN